MSRPLRIAAILRALPGASGRGGVSFQVHELCDRLTRNGHDVTIFSTDPAPEAAGYAVVRIDVPEAVKDRRWFLYAGFARLVRGQDFRGFDLIHAHGDNHFLSRPPVPVVRTYWGSDLGEALGDLRPAPLLSHLAGYASEWLAREHSDTTVGISQATRRALPFLDAIVSPGVDLEVFRPGERKSPEPSILFVAGTLGGRKRGRLLVDAFLGPVRAAHPDAQLWLVGPERVEGPGIVNFGSFPPGPEGTRRIAALYQQAWAFCLPSSYEGFGVPYVEALACGTPVVATPNPGAREVLEDGRLGLLTRPEELGATLVRVLGDEALRRRLVAEGVTAAKRYAFPAVVGRYEEVFAETIARARQQPRSR